MRAAGQDRLGRALIRRRVSCWFLGKLPSRESQAWIGPSPTRLPATPESGFDFCRSGYNSCYGVVYAAKPGKAGID